MNIVPFIAISKCCQDCSRSISDVDKNVCKMNMFSYLHEIVSKAYEDFYVLELISEEEYSIAVASMDSIAIACHRCNGKKSKVFEKVEKDYLRIYFKKLSELKKEEKRKRRIIKKGKGIVVRGVFQNNKKRKEKKF
jgi:hypothetical protein